MAKAVRFRELGGPEVLRLEDVPVEEPGDDEVRIRVDAIGLNRSEANFRRGRYLDRPRQLPSGLGYEAAGEIEAIGPRVHGWAEGDAVSVLPTFPQSRYHTYGQVAVVPASALVLRGGMTAIEGAAVWMPYLTAYGALIDIARLRPGDHVVITAASSSVGLAAIQIVNRIGAVPVATTHRTDKRQRLLDNGAAAVIVTDQDDVAEEIRRLTGGRGAQFVFDAVAGPGVEALAEATAPDGTLFIHGSLSGQDTPLPGLATMRPVYVRPYTVFEILGDEDRRRRAEQFVVSGLRSAALRPVIDRVFELDDIVAAHRYLESGDQLGKVVVAVQH